MAMFTFWLTFDWERRWERWHAGARGERNRGSLGPGGPPDGRVGGYFHLGLASGTPPRVFFAKECASD